jgi:hypothetical protein
VWKLKIGRQWGPAQRLRDGRSEEEQISQRRERFTGSERQREKLTSAVACQLPHRGYVGPCHQPDLRACERILIVAQRQQELVGERDRKSNKESDRRVTARDSERQKKETKDKLQSTKKTTERERIKKERKKEERKARNKEKERRENKNHDS